MPHPVVRTPTEGKSLAIMGDLYRFLATGEDTGGKYASWEATVLPDGGPPPHVHTREEESFYVLEGEITFQIGDQRITASAGTFANIPIGTVHSFKNEGQQPARMLITVAPAGLEEMFFEIGKPCQPGQAVPRPSMVDIEVLLAAAPRYGLEIKVP